MYTPCRYSILLLGLLLAAGCVSTQERYDQAEDLTAQGRYAEAARYYVKVLEKDPDWPDARERLEEVGARAVEAYLAEAEAAQAEGHYAGALGVLDRLDALRADAVGVGVTLDVPEGYAAFRDALADAALVAAVHDGEAAERRGDWAAALAAYERATAYTGDPDRRADLRRRQARVHLIWAGREADAGHYRAAFDRAGQVFDLLSPGHPLADDAHVLQEDALAAGTRRVAFLPFWQTEAVEREAPPGLLTDLNDVLLYEYWTAPVAFVAPANPVDVGRELRRLRYDRTVITRRQAAEIGRVVEADYVVVGEWTGLVRTERNVKETVRRAPLRGRASTIGGRTDTTYVEQRLTLELDGTVVYRIIDPLSRRVVDEGRVSAEASDRFTRAVYAGDYRTLDLSGSERSLFEDAERLAAEDLVNDLVDEMAARLADRIFDRLLRQIP